MPPTTFLFKWEIGHISQFCLGKNQGAPKKQHCCFCCFFEKNRPLEKHRFSQVVEISEIENRKNGQKSLNGGPPPQNNFGRTFGQNTRDRQKFRSEAA